jgi:hypothetical protein
MVGGITRQFAPSHLLCRSIQITVLKYATSLKKTAVVKQMGRLPYEPRQWTRSSSGYHAYRPLLINTHPQCRRGRAPTGIYGLPLSSPFVARFPVPCLLPKIHREYFPKVLHYPPSIWWQPMQIMERLHLLRLQHYPIRSYYDLFPQLQSHSSVITTIYRLSLRPQIKPKKDYVP